MNLVKKMAAMADQSLRRGCEKKEDYLDGPFFEPLADNKGMVDR